MNQYLRNLTADQQVGALFIIVFRLLLFIASATVFMLSLRERGERAGRPGARAAG
jgi:hypothetical protein